MKRVTRLGGDVKKKSTAKVLRVAAYCRVSTGSDAQLESLDAQKTHYENYINGREDWEFAGLYFDEGISGTKKEKRPALLQMIADCKAGKIDFKVDKFGIVHSSVGKIAFSAEQIADNASEFMNTILKLKPTTAKGTYVKSIFLSTTMSPGLQIDPKSVETK